MKLFIATKNSHKVEEAKFIFSEFRIEVEQLDYDKYEPKEMGLQEVAEFNSKAAFVKIKKPVVVDDTGVFFKAYPDFPGNHPKLIFDLLGYKGLLKLVEGESREAQFRTVVSYFDGKVLKSFFGELDCTIDIEVHDLSKDVLPYERILLVDGRPISSFSREEKNKISHRAKAFRKLAEFLISDKRSNITI
jgi:XTP/dITP diphosphohydrolase